MKYGLLKFIQDGEDFEDFEKVAYPDSDGVSTGFPNWEAAIEFLMKYEDGQDIPEDDIREEKPSFIFKWDFENEHETDDHYFIWNVSRSCVAVYRKITD